MKFYANLLVAEMPNYFIYTYAVAALLAILLACIGLSPSFINYNVSDYGLFIVMLSYAYFLSVSLMLTLAVPKFRKPIVAMLGKRLIMAQVVVSLLFILWGTMMIFGILARQG
jgi:hypothetical protein